MKPSPKKHKCPEKYNKKPPKSPQTSGKLGKVRYRGGIIKAWRSPEVQDCPNFCIFFFRIKVLHCLNVPSFLNLVFYRLGTISSTRHDSEKLVISPSEKLVIFLIDSSFRVHPSFDRKSAEKPEIRLW